MGKTLFLILAACAIIALAFFVARGIMTLWVFRRGVKWQTLS